MHERNYDRRRTYEHIPIRDQNTKRVWAVSKCNARSGTPSRRHQIVRSCVVTCTGRHARRDADQGKI
ncbi:hypothetical protein BD414DRAFT_495941 [Trametes punicea]|nr:hypothetical protein BD414DRAFT_495941 [Trametes punicea]